MPSSPVYKSTIAVHNEDDKIIIHRNGGGFWGSTKAWNTYFFQSSVATDNNNNNHHNNNDHSSKYHAPSKLFAIFHLLRNPFLWHLLFPILFLSLAILFYVESDRFYPIHDSPGDSNQNGAPLWIPSGVNALLLLAAFLSATVIPRLISPLLLSERGHRSDWRLPVDFAVVPARPNNNSNRNEVISTVGASPTTMPITPPSSPPLVSLIKNNCPFNRVPLTPKAVGFFACIMFHPISHFILLFTNAFLPEGFFSPSSSSSQRRTSVLQYSPFSFVASWFTFDFVKYTATMVEDHPQIACAIGRFWWWLVVIAVLLLFYAVLLGVFWNVTAMQIDRLGHRFKHFPSWTLVWSVGLAFFPIFYRVLWTGFGCFSTSRVFDYFNSSSRSPVILFDPSNATATSIPVISICPSQRCNSDSQTATIVFAFIVLVLTLPIFLNIHTQLRRLSGIPTLQHNQKVQPLPRVDGLHLYLLILIRFLVPAFSGVFGNMTSVCLVAFFLDFVLVIVTWISPNVTNIKVVNFWWKNWCVPASFSSSLLFTLWTALVWNHDAINVEWSTGLETTITMGSLGLQLLAFFMLIFFFATTYFSFKSEFRERRGGSNLVLTNMQAMLRYDIRSLLHDENGRRSTSSTRMSNSQSSSSSPLRSENRAVGGAIQSSVSSRTAQDTAQEFSPTSLPTNEREDGNFASPTAAASPTPRNDNHHHNENDDAANERDPFLDENNHGDEDEAEEDREIYLHDEAASLSLFGDGGGDGYKDPLDDISSHVSFG